MPIVLAENEETESGIHYADRTGVSYQYPKRYRGLVREGERFVYYRGRKTKKNSRQPQVYFGFGLIGKTGPDSEAPGRMKCSIVDYTPFNSPLFFKSANGRHLEKGGSRRGYFQPGVRWISDEEYDGILGAASPTKG
jgi:hypothetical protein